MTFWHSSAHFTFLPTSTAPEDDTIDGALALLPLSDPVPVPPASPTPSPLPSPNPTGQKERCVVSHGSTVTPSLSFASSRWYL